MTTRTRTKTRAPLHVITKALVAVAVLAATFIAAPAAGAEPTGPSLYSSSSGVTTTSRLPGSEFSFVVFGIACRTATAPGEFDYAPLDDAVFRLSMGGSELAVFDGQDSVDGWLSFSAMLTVPDLSPGNYPIVLSVLEGACAGQEMSVREFTVDPPLTAATATVSSTTPVEGTSVDLVVTGLTCTATGTYNGPVRVTAGTFEETVTSAGGAFTIPVVAPEASSVAVEIAATQFPCANRPALRVATLNPVSGETTVALSTTTPTEMFSMMRWSATVESASSDVTPVGNVEFRVAGVTLATAPLNGDGVASHAFMILFGGPVQIEALFIPTGPGWLPSSTSETMDVDRLDATLGITGPATATYGDTPTIDIAMGGIFGAPSGTVTITADGETLTVVDLEADGSATATVPVIDAGTHTLEVTYSGDTIYEPMTSTHTLEVAPVATATISVTVDPLESVLGDTSTLIAEVSLETPMNSSAVSTAAAPLIPTGDVTFYVDGINVGTAPLVAGVARLPYVFATAGAHNVVASYNGSTNVSAVAAAASNVVAVTVTPPPAAPPAPPAPTPPGAPTPAPAPTPPAGGPGAGPATPFPSPAPPTTPVSSAGERTVETLPRTGSATLPITAFAVLLIATGFALRPRRRAAR